ncbi:MAG: dihydroxyacetone kinase subunit DhaK [Eubacteriales bacterium]|nr:dihydroxyacetone kinase subunit DhaK [Eubacteriales bacterium]
MRMWDLKDNAHAEAIEGYIRANKGYYERVPSEHGYGLYRTVLPNDRVRIIINGGGGYGPMWSGFADEGLADAMVHGSFDCAPNAFVLYETAKKIEAGRGVLFLANNFMGDYLNNDMAIELLERDGIKASACYASDDVCSYRGEEKDKRGGLHGIGQLCKIGAKAAKNGLNLCEVTRLVEKGNARMRSISLGIRNAMCFWGEGFSGEEAAFREHFTNVSQTVERCCDILLGEMSEWDRDDIYISLNPFSGVSYTESYVILKYAVAAIEKRHRKIWGCACGNYFDVFQGSGYILSLLACDAELKEYVAPVRACGFVV